MFQCAAINHGRERSGHVRRQGLVQIMNDSRPFKVGRVDRFDHLRAQAAQERFRCAVTGELDCIGLGVAHRHEVGSDHREVLPSQRQRPAEIYASALAVEQELGCVTLDSHRARAYAAWWPSSIYDRWSWTPRAWASR